MHYYKQQQYEFDTAVQRAGTAVHHTVVSVHYCSSSTEVPTATTKGYIYRVPGTTVSSTACSTSVVLLIVVQYAIYTHTVVRTRTRGQVLHDRRIVRSVRKVHCSEGLCVRTQKIQRARQDRSKIYE